LRRRRRCLRIIFVFSLNLTQAAALNLADFILGRRRKKILCCAQLNFNRFNIFETKKNKQI
jgi:hypothetical protein